MIKTTLAGSQLPVLQSQLLSKEAGIIHFCTLRNGSGSAYDAINLCSYTGDDPEHVLYSRRLYSSALDITLDRIWFPRQVHGVDIAIVDSSMSDGLEVDAVITTEKNLLIGVSTADCVPVLLYDVKNNVVGAAHAGWRGTVAGIAGKTVRRICELTGDSADSIVAMIGPSISPEAFEVGDEVAEKFIEAGFACCVNRNYVKPHIDLWEANRLQLISAGIGSDNIDCSPICTFSHCEELFSARRLGIKSGRIVSAIMLI